MRYARAGRRVRDALEALPEAVAVAEQGERDALAREVEARTELVAAERRLDEVSGGRRASDEAKTEAVRAVRRATVAASDAADTVARMRERVAALASDEVALRAEADGLAVEARQRCPGGRRGAAPLRLRPLGAQVHHSPRSTSGGHVLMRRSSWFVAASRASGRRSCSRHTPWRRPRSVSRRPASASRSCGAGSRSR